MGKLPIHKSFDKDNTANELVRLMMDDGFSDMPDSYKAEQLGVSLNEYREYMNDPSFLRWAVKNMQDLYVAKLPEMLNTMFSQAIEGKGRQQRMLLDFMKITNEEKDSRSPNIVIVNNIPNPDEKNLQQNIVNLEEISNGRVSSIS